MEVVRVVREPVPASLTHRTFVPVFPGGEVNEDYFLFCENDVKGAVVNCNKDKQLIEEWGRGLKDSD